MILPYKSDVQTRGLPYLTMALLISNVVALAYTTFLGSSEGRLFYFDWGFVPIDHKPLNLLTSMFLHGDFLHLAGNMLFLWVFGPAVEDRLGRLFYIPAYLLFGALAAYVHSMATPEALRHVPCVGASGAISGLLGVYMVCFPRVMIRHLFLVLIKPVFFSLPAWIVLGLWFMEQSFMTYYLSDHISVAVWAHIGGFVAGAFCGYIMPATKNVADGVDAPSSDASRDKAKSYFNNMKEAVEKEPADLGLWQALAVAAIRADEHKAALEAAKYVYARLPEGDLLRRLDIRLIQTGFGETDGTAKTIMELAEGFYTTGHFIESLPLYRQVLEGWADHPKRVLIQLRMGEILAEHFKRPEEGMPLLEEVARGDPRNGLVQEAQFLIKKLTPQGPTIH